jgi:hypothetical protein
VFGNQRRRWLSAQFHYFRKDFERAKDLILKGNIDYFDKAIQFIYSPRILLGAVVLFWFFLANYLLNNQIPYTNCWIIGRMLCFILCLCQIIL